MDTQLLRSQQDNRMTLEEMFESFDTLRFAVLATSEQGSPYTSLIAFALTPDRHTLIFATPKATRKYENIISQPAVSILVDNRSQEAGDIQGAQAVTLLGTAQEVSTPAQKAAYQAVLVKRHPELAAFLDDPGTALIAVTIHQAVHVAHFQDVSRWP
jgi:nitroimidazol reductase NimA-like FMN-containing flavoprotein (pyridoxamine 5'-phosphate oxidase superfamily)